MRQPLIATWSRDQRGFSLIELLVVISIMGLLTAITMPVMTRARSLARQTVCQSRLHQWGLAFELYAEENNRFFPHADGRDRSGSSRPSTSTGLADYESGWIDVLPPLMGEESWRDHKPYAYPGPDSILQCPSARLVSLDQYGYRPLRNGYFSYAMNSCLELDGNCWPPYDDPGGNDMPSFLNTLLIEQPRRVIVLFDQLLDPEKGFGGNRIDRSAGKHCGGYPKAFSARHARVRDQLGGNILYADYHVDWQATVWKPEWPLDSDFQAPPRNDPDWYPY